MAMKLEGRLAGPWVAELHTAWGEAAPRLGSRRLLIDLSDITYADERGKRVLRLIYAQTGAELLTSTPWTQFLAEEVTANLNDEGEGADHAECNG